MFYLRRQIPETPRFEMATQGDAAAAKPSFAEGFRQLLRNPHLLTWLVGAASTWFLLDFAYYGNTVSSQLILSALDPQKELRTDLLLQLLIFVVAALPGYALAAYALDRLGRKAIQLIGFAGSREVPVAAEEREADGADAWPWPSAPSV